MNPSEPRLEIPMSMKTISIPLFLIVVLSLSATPLLAQDDAERLRQEEAEDYYEKWLREDVKYIITDEEKAVFRNLTTPEEKEQFIEQFWFRRDPDPRTPVNEFKDEHYRRIAYANERFASGLPGWMTDRGRIYIIHGPPVEIESHPSGGTYQRPIHEGGGTTSTFPFEIWRYRHIEGIGSDIELEFVDPSFSGEYRLSHRPEEKDALLHVPGAGLTLAEEMGLATKADRPYFSPGMRDYPFMMQRMKDSPFERYETYTQVQAAQPIKYNDLKELVQINVGYENLPFTNRQDYFRLNDDQDIVPITIQLRNRDLTFKQEGDVQVARLAIYGIVTSITNRVITEFDDDVLVSYRPEFLEEGLQKFSIYQKILTVDRNMRYKVDLVVKDLNSGNVGVKRSAIIPPGFSDEKLTASSLVLANYIETLPQVPNENEMFVLGDVKVRPNLLKVFSPQEDLGVYLQVYNAALDQATFSPALSVTYRIVRDGTVIKDIRDESGESTQFFSGQRIVLIKNLDLQDLEPGKYRLQVEIHDRIGDQTLTTDDEFTIGAIQQLASAN
ncbi:MAG TPA: GWxTD domain-containing protein [Acidobacteriota bacterium]|nr:GWxTD domain-containing protein [Acidobacteriota bacterium]